jgi:cell wall-associated NlpC family hydrolase
MAHNLTQMITQPQRIIRIFSLAITVLAMAACGSNPSDKAAAPSASPGDRAAIIALDQVGEPYRYGGNSPGGFDCSGLVQYSYSRAGYSTPRTTGQLWSAVKTVDRHQIRTGDLLFFSRDDRSQSSRWMRRSTRPRLFGRAGFIENYWTMNARSC